ncbi:YcxB family protein [Lacrimispora sp.]|uniref:YcxB family protein n=1 Tax=Lacrimispora sp. TaxID=2719234 RepID=UPI0034602791
MEEIKYIIRTTMEKEDYRKFLYLATFCRNKMVIPLIASIAFAGSLLINWNLHLLNWVAITLSWVFLFALAIITVCFMVERKNKPGVTSEHTRTFDSLNILKFYEEKVVMENDLLKSTGELKYTQFFSVIESKNYFIFYLTVNQAFPIRKKDVDSPDAFKQFVMKVFNDKYKHI